MPVGEFIPWTSFVLGDSGRRSGSIKQSRVPEFRFEFVSKPLPSNPFPPLRQIGKPMQCTYARHEKVLAAAEHIKRFDAMDAAPHRLLGNRESRLSRL